MNTTTYNCNQCDFKGKRSQDLKTHWTKTGHSNTVQAPLTVSTSANTPIDFDLSSISNVQIDESLSFNVSMISEQTAPIRDFSQDVFTEEQMEVLEPLLIKSSQMAIRQYLLGSNIVSDQDYEYQQPIVLKYVNASLCHQILEGVVQVDAKQFYPTIAALSLNQEDPTERLISKVCAQLVNKRNDASYQHVDKIKSVVNSLVGYIAMAQDKVNNLPQLLKEQAQSHRCTRAHQKIIQRAFEIMDNLKTLLTEQGVQILAFKTDAIFILDPLNKYTDIVTKYFKSTGFGYKVIKYTKLIHAASRGSDQDVSCYMGLTSDNAVELNGIGLNSNNHLLIEICRQVLANKTFNIGYAVEAQFYEEFTRLTTDQSYESIYQLVKQQGYCQQYKIIHNDTEQLLTIKDKRLTGYSGRLVFTDLTFNRNDRELKATIKQLYWVIQGNAAITNKGISLKSYMDEDIDQCVQVKIDAVYQCNLDQRVALAQKDGYFNYISIDQLTEMLKVQNVSVHEAFLKSTGRMFLDIDCSRKSHLKWYNMDLNALSQKVIRLLKSNSDMINQPEFRVNVCGYKTIERASLHIVANIIVPFNIQLRIAKVLSAYFKTIIDGKDQSIIDLQLYSGNKTMRLPYCQKISKDQGITEDRALMPLDGSSNHIQDYFITQCLGEVQEYLMPEYLISQPTLSIESDCLNSDLQLDIVPALIKEQLRIQYNLTYKRTIPTSKHFGKVIIEDYIDTTDKCPFCQCKHEVQQNRVTLQYKKKSVNDQVYLEIQSFQCLDKANTKPLMIPTGQQVLKQRPVYTYKDLNTYNMNTKYVSDALPCVNACKVVEYVNSDMGSGKSKRYGDIIKMNNSGLFLGVRKSQTRDFTSTYNITSYEEVTGNMDCSYQWFMVQVDSINRVASFGCVVIIDEFMSILAHVQKLPNSIQLFKRLAQVMLEAKQLYIGDNFLEQSVVEIVNIFLKQFAPKDNWQSECHFNSYKHRQGNSIEVYKDFAGLGKHNLSQEHLDIIVGQIVNACNINSKLHDSPNKMGRCASFIGSKTLLCRVKEELINKGYRVQDYHGGDNEVTQDFEGNELYMSDKKLNDFQDMVNESNKWNVVLYSQTITVGVNIPNPKFTHGVHYFKQGTGSQIQFLQGIERFRYVTKHVVFSNDMVYWDANATHNQTLEQAYQNTELLNEDNEYYTLDTNTKAGIMLQSFTNSFYHCLGLLGIDYAVQKWTQRGYSVKVHEDTKQVVNEEPSVLNMSITQKSFRELNPELFPKSREGIAEFLSNIQVERVADMLRDKYEGNCDNFYREYPCGELFSQLVLWYNAYLRTNIYDTIKEDIKEQCSQRVKVLNNTTKDMQLLWSQQQPDKIYSKHAVALMAFAKQINTGKASLFTHIQDSLEASQMHSNHKPAVAIVQEDITHQVRDKKLRATNLRLDDNQKSVLVKGAIPLTIDGMKGFIKFMDTIQRVEPEKFKLIGKQYQTEEPTKFIEWATTTTEGIKCRTKEKMLQILGYSTHYVCSSKTMYYSIKPIGINVDAPVDVKWRLNITKQ